MGNIPFRESIDAPASEEADKALQRREAVLRKEREDAEAKRAAEGGDGNAPNPTDSGAVG